jgi:choice-of-anchor A domain-containing protein
MVLRNLWVTGVFSVVVLGFSAPRAEAASYLYAASQYNIFVQNYLTFGGPDSVGAVAAGGNMTLGGSVSVASGYGTGFPHYSVVAGGTLACPTNGSGCIADGNIWAHAETGLIYNNTSGGTNTIGGTTGTDPVDFSNNFAELKGLSTWLTGEKTTAGDGCTYAFTVLTCTASASGLNVIDIGANATYLSTANLVFTMAAGATLVINVDGSVSNSLGSSGHGFSVTDQQKLLFNYSSNTPLLNLGGTVDGSLLAPYSNVTAATGITGQFTGNLIAQSYSGTGVEFENDLFNGELPEPGTFAMLGGGVLLLWAARRRARRQAVN